MKYIESITKYISWWLPIICLIYFYWPGLFENKIRVEPVYCISANKDTSLILKSYNQDVTKVNYPYWIYKHWAVHNQNNIEFNPYQFSGQPLWGEAVFGFLSIRSLITYFMEPNFSFTFGMFLHGILLVIFSNLLLSLFKLPGIYKALSVLTTSFTTEALSIQQNNYSEINLWLLAMILLFTYIWKNSHKIEKIFIKITIIGIFIWSMTIFINHPLYLAQNTLVLLVFVLVISKIDNEGNTRNFHFITFFIFLIIIVFSIGLTAIQWVPVFETMELSYRSITPKSTFLPIYFRFMPLALPYEPVSYALRDLLNFIHYEDILHLIKFDGKYISLTLYFLIIIIFFEPETRKITKIFWQTYIIIFCSYNFLAILVIIPFFKNILLTSGFIRSVHINNIVLFANILLYILPGFGLYAFIKLWKINKNIFLLKLWSLIVFVVIIFNFIFSYFYRLLLDSRYGIKGLAYFYNPPLNQKFIEKIRTITTDIIHYWDPIPLTFLIAIVILIVEFILLLLTKIEKIRDFAIFLFLITSILITLSLQSNITVWTDKKKLVPKIEAIDYIKNNKEIGRVTAIRINNNQISFAPEINLNSVIKYKELPFMPAMSLLYRVEDIRGVSSLNNKDYRIFLESITSQINSSKITVYKMDSEIITKQNHQRSWDLLNTKWILSPDSINFQHYELILDGNLKLYKNNAAMPRIWFSNKFLVISDRKRILQKINDPMWNPNEILFEVKPRMLKNTGSTKYGYKAQELILSDNNSLVWYYSKNIASRLWLPEINQNDKIFKPDSTASAKIFWITKDAGNYKIRVESSGNGFIFFSEVFQPGWKLKINGKYQNLYRADYALMATPIVAGNNIIELFYSSDSTRDGFKITITSFITMILFIFIIFIYLKKKKDD